MSQVTTIDAGDCTGWSTFVSGWLQSCGIGKHKLGTEPDLGECPILGSDTVLIEEPQDYAGGRRKVDPNVLIKLARKVGDLERLARTTPGVRIVKVVKPYEYKGQTPKTIHHRRVIKHLTPQECAVIVAAIRAKKITERQARNMMDAIGLGLWWVSESGERPPT